MKDAEAVEDGEALEGEAGEGFQGMQGNLWRVKHWRMVKQWMGKDLIVLEQWAELGPAAMGWNSILHGRHFSLQRFSDIDLIGLIMLLGISGSFITVRVTVAVNIIDVTITIIC